MSTNVYHDVEFVTLFCSEIEYLEGRSAVDPADVDYPLQYVCVARRHMHDHHGHQLTPYPHAASSEFHPKVPVLLQAPDAISPALPPPKFIR